MTTFKVKLLKKSMQNKKVEKKLGFFHFIYFTEIEMVLILSVPSCVRGSGLQWLYQSGAVLRYNRVCHSWTIPGLNT